MGSFFARYTWITLVAAAGLAACGDDGGGNSGDDGGDDAPADAQPDEAPADAAWSTVTVSVHDHAAPAAGAKVAFLGPNDAVIETGSTDSLGAITATVPPHSKVVAMSLDGSIGYLWLDVGDGDTLSLDLFATNTTSATTFVAPAVSGTSLYYVESSCGPFGVSATTTVTASVVANCGPTDLVLYRLVGSTLPDALVLRNQTLTPGTTYDLSMMSYIQTVDASLTVTNVPAPYTQVVLGGSLALSFDAQVGTFNDTLPLTSGAASLTGKLPTANNVAQMSFVRLRATGSHSHQIYRRAPLGTGAIDVAPLLLPTVTAPVYDELTRTVTWTQGASGATVEGIALQVNFSSGVRWVIASPSATSVAIPPLPAELSAIDPAARTFQSGQTRLFSLPGGYSAARATMFSVSSPRGLLGADGTIVVSDSGTPSS